jgi:hypothetical protein
MPDQKHLGAVRAGAPREQMSRALELGRHLDPLDGEAELGELAAEDVSDRAHACMIHRSAVDIHELLDERLDIDGLRVDPRDDRLFGCVESGGRYVARQERAQRCKHAERRASALTCRAAPHGSCVRAH